MQAKESPARPNHGLLRVVLVLLALPLLLVSMAIWWWDKEPALLDPAVPPRIEQTAMKRPMTQGAATTVSLIRSIQSLEEKHAGRRTKGHRQPPAEETAGWQRGSLMATRDLLHFLRGRLGRPNAPMVEDKDLADADLLLASRSHSPLRNAESQYRKVAEHLQNYLDRLTDDDPANAHFHASAANLADYLDVASDRLDVLSQHLATGVATPRPGEFAPGRWPQLPMIPLPRKGNLLPWRHVDDAFYEASGYTETLLGQMKAFQRDFGPVLQNPDAQAELRQAIAALEALQQAPGNPLALQGAPSVRFPNHELALADGMSRVNLAVSGLRDQLRRS
jgi:hypothetical protein